MKTKLKCYSFVSIFLLCSKLTMFGADWQDLNEELRQEIRNGQSIESITNAVTFRRLLQASGRAEFTEMCYQHNQPYVVLAGFFGVQQKSPADAYLTALKIAWNSGQNEITFLVPYVYLYLTNRVDQNSFESDFKIVMQIPPRDFACAAIAIQQINPILLENWFDHETERDLSRCLPANVSLVLERLCNNSMENKHTIAKNVSNQLLDYKDIPGYPQLMYLLYFPEENDELQILLKNVLENDRTSPDDLYSLVANRSSLIRHMLENNELHLSQSRLERIQKYLVDLNKADTKNGHGSRPN